MSSRNNKRKRSDEEEEEALIHDYERLMSKPINVDFASNYLFDSLIGEIITNIGFRAHFEVRHDMNANGQPLPDSLEEINEKLVNCLNCKKVVAAVKFASHLERCMGLGRNSRRIATINKTKSYDCGSDQEVVNTKRRFSDPSRRVKKKKKSKHIPKTKSLLSKFKR